MTQARKNCIVFKITFITKKLNPSQYGWDFFLNIHIDGEMAIILVSKTSVQGSNPCRCALTI